MSSFFIFACFIASSTNLSFTFSWCFFALSGCIPSFFEVKLDFTLERIFLFFIIPTPKVSLLYLKCSTFDAKADYVFHFNERNSGLYIVFGKIF